MAHRIISRDGWKECFACGTAVEIVSDGDESAVFDQIACKPGGWAHPAYVIGDHVETCLAHETYECVHVATPEGPIFIDPKDRDCATGACGECGLPIEYDPRNSWQHALHVPTGDPEIEYDGAYTGGAYASRGGNL